jgi:hypothetical protein
MTLALFLVICDRSTIKWPINMFQLVVHRPESVGSVLLYRNYLEYCLERCAVYCI